MNKVIKVQSQTGEVIQEMILLDDQSQPLPSPLSFLENRSYVSITGARLQHYGGET